MARIAFVEDEKNLANLIVKYFQSENYDIVWYETGEAAMEGIGEHFDLWILDIMLPGVLSGYDLIRNIRKVYPQMPVIFTSARDQDIDKIMGLELGGDDYLSKPYSIKELILRVQRILQRTYEKPASDKVVVLNEYTIDLAKRSVSFHGENILLTSKEYDLLVFFLKHPANAFSREQILNAVWGTDYFGSDRAVDDLLRRLRQKMPKLSIETIYGYGYRLLK